MKIKPQKRLLLALLLNFGGLQAQSPEEVFKNLGISTYPSLIKTQLRQPEPIFFEDMVVGGDSYDVVVRMAAKKSSAARYLNVKLVRNGMLYCETQTNSFSVQRDDFSRPENGVEQVLRFDLDDILLGKIPFSPATSEFIESSRPDVANYFRFLEQERKTDSKAWYPSLALKEGIRSYNAPKKLLSAYQVKAECGDFYVEGNFKVLAVKVGSVNAAQGNNLYHNVQRNVWDEYDESQSLVYRETVWPTSFLLRLTKAVPKTPREFSRATLMYVLTAQEQ